MKTFESCNNLCSNYDCDNETGFPQNMIKPLHFQCTFLLQESAIFWGWNVTFLMHKNFCRVVGLSRSNRNIPKDAHPTSTKSLRVVTSFVRVVILITQITFFKSYQKWWFLIFKFWSKNYLFLKVRVRYLSWCKIFVRVVTSLRWCWNIRNEPIYHCENFCKL